MTATPKSLPARAGKSVLALAVAVCIAAALARHRGDLHAALANLHLDPALLAAAFAVAVVYRLVNCVGWVLVLHALRCPLPTLQGMRLWLVSETMRWLPGSVWSYVSRVYAARQAGIDPLRASWSISLELLLTIAAWWLTAAAGLACSGLVARDLSKFVRLPPGPLVLAVAGGAILGGGLALWIVLRTKLLARLPEKARNLVGDLCSLVRSPPRPDYCFAAAALYVALCVLNGLNLCLVLRSLSPVAVPIFAVVGINALGWLIGFFAFMAPGGLGVREAGIAGLLTLFYPLPVALGGALVWRLLQIASELLCLLFCLLPVNPPGKISGVLRDVPAENV